MCERLVGARGMQKCQLNFIVIHMWHTCKCTVCVLDTFTSETTFVWTLVFFSEAGMTHCNFLVLSCVGWYTWREWRVLVRIIGFISTLVTIFLNYIYYRQYSAIADLRTFQFTVAHALGFSVSTSCLLVTDLNTETINSDHSDGFLSLATLYSSFLICTRSPQFTLNSRPCTLSCWTFLGSPH
jgi:hypothetical protein